MRLLTAVAIALIALPAACSRPAPAPTPLRGTIGIGVDLPLSGADGAFGRPALSGIQAAIRANGPVRGYRLELTAYDDAVRGDHNPGAGAADLARLVADPRILGVIGPFNADVAVAQIPIARAAHLALISPAVTNECLTRSLPYCEGLAGTLRAGQPPVFFRATGTDDLQGPAMASFAYGTLGLRSIAVVSDGGIYGRALADSFQVKFGGLGGSIALRSDLDPAAPREFVSLLQDADHAGAEAIYYGGVTAGGGCILRAQMAGQMRAGAPELGGEGFGLDDQCIREAGSNAAGMYSTAVSLNADSIPAAAPTIASIRHRFPAESDYSVFTVPAYDATRVLLAAIGRAIDSAGAAAPPTREQVRQEVARTTAFPTAAGPFSFDASGDSTLRYVSIYATSGTPLTWTFLSQATY